MPKKIEIELKVGLFVAIGVGLICVAILVLGSNQNLLQRKSHYTLHFETVDGLIPGSKVGLSGISVGTVDQIDFDPASHNIKVTIDVASNYATWIRKDTYAEVVTQGVLGDKYIMLTPGTQQQPAIESGAEISVRTSAGLNQFLSKGDQLMVSLNSIASGLDRLLKSFESGNRSDTLFGGMAATAKNLSLMTEKLNREFDDIHIKSSIKSLNGILEKINDGTGTLGMLINDPGLYDDAKALMGGANRNRIMRNLVRQTIKTNEAETDKK